LAPESQLDDYLHETRGLAVSLVYVIPLLLLYEYGIAETGSSVQNAAGVIVKSPLALLGWKGMMVFNLLVLAVLVGIAIRLVLQSRLDPLLIGPIVFEGALYALVFGKALAIIVCHLVSLEIPHRAAFTRASSFFLALGAGVYEEIVFRLILLKLIQMILEMAFEVKTEGQKIAVSVTSILAAALVFAAMHYVGPLSDTFTGHSFLFRFLAGIVLSAIFMFRGLAVAVYTHALYDVLLTL